MRPPRKGTPPPEMWGVEDVMNYLNCDRMKAKQVLDEYHDINGGGYGEVKKHLILDFINEKQRLEREREAKYQSDLANVETTTILKEQVKVLKEQVQSLREMCDSSSRDAHKAHVLSVVSIIVAVVALLMQLK